MRGWTLCLATALSTALTVQTMAAPPKDLSRELFKTISRSKDFTVVEWQREILREAAAAKSPIMADGFPLGNGTRVSLELEPFSITNPTTRFVIGRKGQPDAPLDYDPAGVTLLRGRVSGRSSSRVFLALSETLITGSVEVDGRLFRISSRDHRGAELPIGRATVFEATGSASLPPDVPVCGSGTAELEPATGLPSPVPAEAAELLAGGPRQIEMAVETDFEFFQLFGDATAAADYLVALYAEISEIYVRDVNARVDLVFSRLWDQPDDLFNDVDPSPLADFRNYWNSNMGAVDRDVVQLLSGRRDYPFGGQGYLSSLCGNNAYSVVGYISGSFPDPSQPSPYQYDIGVAAHELGHNSGTGHTHDSPNNLDTCDDPGGTPQRGTIMSYCSQTWSGGRSNKDMYFHTVIQGNMDNHISNANCVVFDCNGNGIDDATDIAGASLDADGDSIPDECQDCNGNSTLDSVDIAGGSPDVNGNGIPDACETDCDGSGVPDEYEISQGVHTDLYGDGIPDLCEADCDNDGTSDYTQIQGSMSLDINRDAALDACEDCDGDSTLDADELNGAHDSWVASGLTATPVRTFHSVTGVYRHDGGALVQEGQDVLVTPDARVLVTSATDNRVLEFDRDGVYLGDLVAAGGGGLAYPTGLALAPDGRLLVSSRNTDSVLAFDAISGNSLGAFVAAGSGGLDAPYGMTFGPSGNLFVASSTNEVVEYDGSTGALVGTFVPAANNGGLDQPRGLIFKPDGHLLVASYGSDEVLEFESGSGAPMGKWAQVGTATNLTQTSPWGIRVGPNGNVFVTRTGDAFGSGDGGEDHDEHHDEAWEKGVVNLHLTNAQIYEFNIRNGNFVRTYLGGNDHPLAFPTGFDFVPGWDVDCNYNQLPDGCDISSGTSTDTDLSGIPDECELDCNANGIQDRLDLIPYGSSLDCNFNLLPDECDIASAASADCNLDGVPDECQVSDDLENTSGWTAGAPGDTATSGFWTLGDPNGTLAQPEDDHTRGSGSLCFFTGQAQPADSIGTNDVDGGFTTLISPPFDLDGDVDAEIGYWRWYSNDEGSAAGQDTFRVDVSDNGASWSNVETVGPSGAGTSGGWAYKSFRVSDFVTPGATVQVRFIAEDLGGGSIIEAAVDDLSVVAACAICSVPGEVTGLDVAPGGSTLLTWSAQAPGSLYDVVSGDVQTLRADGSATAATCIADDVVPESWSDIRPDPVAGNGYYYLVRAEQPCGPGTLGIASGGAERIPATACP